MFQPQWTIEKLEFEQSFSGARFERIHWKELTAVKEMSSAKEKDNKRVFKLCSSDVWPGILNTEFASHYPENVMYV